MKKIYIVVNNISLNLSISRSMLSLSRKEKVNKLFDKRNKLKKNTYFIRKHQM